MRAVQCKMAHFHKRYLFDAKRNNLRKLSGFKRLLNRFRRN